MNAVVQQLRLCAVKPKRREFCMHIVRERERKRQGYYGGVKSDVADGVRHSFITFSTPVLHLEFFLASMAAVERDAQINDEGT